MAKEIIYTLKERAYVEQIEKAFNYASKVLLAFLMEEKELVAHLRCAVCPWPPGSACAAPGGLTKATDFFQWLYPIYVKTGTLPGCPA